jgi:hypothetical protein
VSKSAVPEDVRRELRKNARVNTALDHMAAVDELWFFALISEDEWTSRRQFWQGHIDKVQSGEES